MNKKNLAMTNLAIMAAAALLPLAASAHNYTFVEGGYLNRGFEDSDEDAGLRIAGSADLARQLALFGEYADTGEVSTLSAGGLFHTPLTSAIDLALGASLEHADAGRFDDTGFGLRGGVRWQVLNALELHPELRYVDVFEDALVSPRVAALYRIASALDLQGAAQTGDEQRFEVGLRYNFR